MKKIPEKTDVILVSAVRKRCPESEDKCWSIHSWNIVFLGIMIQEPMGDRYKDTELNLVWKKTFFMED